MNKPHCCTTFKLQRLHFLGVLLFVFALCIAFPSCLSDDGIVVTDVDPQGWAADAPAEVVYDNRDTLSERSLAVLLRYTARYAYNGVTLLLTTTTPDGFSWQDTLFVSVGNDKQIPVLNYDVEHLYRNGVCLEQLGAYRFSFVPFSPAPPVQQISGVGIHIY